MMLYNGRTPAGLALCPKITREHVFLNSYSRMRVYLAAQVQSFKGDGNTTAWASNFFHNLTAHLSIRLPYPFFFCSAHSHIS